MAEAEDMADQDQNGTRDERDGGEDDGPWAFKRGED